MIEAPFQWQVVRAQLDPVRGSEQAGERPVLIVSREATNAALPVVTVLPMTTRRRRVYPTEVLLPAGTAGQPHDSIVMAHQIRTVAKERLLFSSLLFGQSVASDLAAALTGTVCTQTYPGHSLGPLDCYTLPE